MKKNKKSSRGRRSLKSVRKQNRKLSKRIKTLKNNNRRGKKRRRTRQRRVNGNSETVTADAAIGAIIRTKNASLAETRLQHREFVYSVMSDDSLYTLAIHEVNPGLPSSFPWLCQIAQHYESYTFNSLKFEFITNMPTDTAGGVSLSPDYDAADDNTSITKARLYSFDDTVRGPIWSCFEMPCTRSNLHKMKEHFVRKDSLASNLDIKTYDVMQLLVAVTGYDTEAIVGDLWVSYDITLRTPQLNKDAGGACSEETGSWDATTPFAAPPYSSTPMAKVGVGSEGTHFHRFDDNTLALHPYVGGTGYYLFNLSDTFSTDPIAVGTVPGFTAATLLEYDTLSWDVVFESLDRNNYSYTQIAALDMNTDIRGNWDDLPRMEYGGPSTGNITDQVFSMVEITYETYLELIGVTGRKKHAAKLKKYKLKPGRRVTKTDLLKIKKTKKIAKTIKSKEKKTSTITLSTEAFTKLLDKEDLRLKSKGNGNSIPAISMQTMCNNKTDKPVKSTKEEKSSDDDKPTTGLVEWVKKYRQSKKKLVKAGVLENEEEEEFQYIDGNDYI